MPYTVQNTLVGSVRILQSKNFADTYDFCFESRNVCACTETADYDHPEFKPSILWNDPASAIKLGWMGEAQLAAQHVAGKPFCKAGGEA